MSSGAAIVPSGSTYGRPIVLSSTSSPGTTIHTATSTTGQIDEVYVEAANTGSSDAVLTVTANNVIVSQVTILAGAGLAIVLNGIRYNGGTVIRAYADTANVINISCIVNRITN